ncbi:MAG: hypothetical protein COB84_04245 [Rhodobacteraceae bacterium]|nr:MAG: hypothetical protein COB84_04245 [Paracoccaceae bacterium]
MNKVITDGIVLMPAAFSEGLDLWSSGDGLSGDASYDGVANASLVAADADFGTCLEMHKTQGTQRLRAFYETPLLSGCYLRVTARVKAVSGALPSVRIAGWAGSAGGLHVGSVVEVGASVALTSYGEIVEVSAIVGGGTRGGVDMIWGTGATFGHFGLDLTGTSGGIIRIEDIIIEDISSAFLSDKVDVVDVKDFGATGDGITNDQAAFEAADAAANGRDILVSEGTFYIGNTITLVSNVRFQGTLAMPDTARLQLARNYNYATYLDAFGDEELALKKALQALMNYTDHESLDLCGYTVSLTEPLDVHAAVGNKDSFSTRRVVRNGSIIATNTSAWDDVVVTGTAQYSSADDKTLSNVANIAAIEVGSLVEGYGVGREVYVSAKNEGAGTITLSQPLWGAASSQSYTFTRFKYLLEFSGFSYLARFVLENIDFNGGGYASGLTIAQDGLIFHIKDCFFTSCKYRCITSAHGGCAGMLIDRCQFLSNELNVPVENRVSIAFNVNDNDAKIRNNRALRFKHFGVLAGAGNVLTGNHFFQGATINTGARTAGLVFTKPNCKTTFTGNYVDNSYIEWNNEHNATPDVTTGYSFGGMTMTGNIFTANSVSEWFRWIHIKPFGINQYLNGVSITNNVFKALGTPKLEAVETVDTSHADLDHSKAKNVTVTGNMFYNITNRMKNPLTVKVNRGSANATWTVNVAGNMPFGSATRVVTSVMARGALKNSSNQVVSNMPYSNVGVGAGGGSFELVWPQATKGLVYATVRCDEPN